MKVKSYIDVLAIMRARSKADAVNEDFNMLAATAAVAELLDAAEYLMPRIISTNGADCVDRMESILDRIGPAK